MRWPKPDPRTSQNTGWRHITSTTPKNCHKCRIRCQIGDSTIFRKSFDINVSDTLFGRPPPPLVATLLFEVRWPFSCAYVKMPTYQAVANIALWPTWWPIRGGKVANKGF